MTNLTPDPKYPGTISKAPGGGWVATPDGGQPTRCTLVPIGNESDLHKRFDRLVRRAERLGLTAPVLTRVADVARQIRAEYGGHRWVRSALYTLVAAPVHFGGWSFVAAIQHMTDDDGRARNIIRSAPAFRTESVSPLLRKAYPVCEHCNTARKRNDTFVIQHNDGSRKQVGRQCLRDYVGDSDGADVLAYAAFESEVWAIADTESWAMGGSVNAWGTATVLALTIASVGIHGWASRSSVYKNGGRSTSSIVLETLTASLNDGAELRVLWKQRDPETRGRFVQPWGKAEEAKAEAVLAWADGIDDDTDSDYLWNLKVACSMGATSAKELGIVCSAVTAYDRAMQRAKADAARAVVAETSKAIGKAGDKIGRKLTAADKRKGAAAHPELTVEVTGTHVINGDYGPTTIVSMSSTCGSVVKWFASGKLTDDGSPLLVGGTYTLVGTVKRHSEYRGVTETQVTRCILTPAR